MKTNKALKRLAKIDGLMSDVAERYSVAPDIRETFQDAKAAVSRAKEALDLQAASEKAKKLALKNSKAPSKAKPDQSKSKRKLSAAGRSKKRRAAGKAAQGKS